ncbi:hypothetical protein ACHAWF_011827, partial [Thalassiosira exigua]
NGEVEGGAAKDEPADGSSPEPSAEAARAPAAAIVSPPASPASPTKKRKKVQFSQRGEEARLRAVARQRKILSVAALRLDAISDTSIEAIEEQVAFAKRAEAEKKKEREEGGEFDDAAADGNVEEGSDDVGSEGKGAGCREGAASSKATPKAATQFACRRSRSSPPTASVVPAKVRVPPLSLNPSAASAAAPDTVKVLRGHKVINVPKREMGSVVLWESPTKLSEGNIGEPPKLLLEEVADLVEKGQRDRSSKEEAEGDVAGGKIQFFVLLLCPTSRIFELVEISASDGPDNDATVGDVLGMIPEKCTDDRLLEKAYVGFVRPKDRAEFVDVGARAFGKQRDVEGEGDRDDWALPPDAIREDDVLVAILEGYSGHDTARIARPILRNSKFRDLIRRRSKKGNRRRASIRDDGSARSHKSSRSRKSGRSSRSRSGRKKKERGHGHSHVHSHVHSHSHSRDKRRHETSSKKRVVVSGIPEDLLQEKDNGKRSSRCRSGGGDEQYTSLCQKLEHLSRKLHSVDDEIAPGGDDEASIASSCRPPQVARGGAGTRGDVAESAKAKEEPLFEVSATPDMGNFRMTPQMVAYEVAANIEDIFADHDVQIVAIDEDDDDSDDDTFATARSSRSMKSVRSARSKGRGFDPILDAKAEPKTDVKAEHDLGGHLQEIIAKEQRPRRPRTTQFDNYEEDDMLLAIEAMAQQADAAFRDRKKDPRSQSVVIEPTILSATIEPRNIDIIDEEDANEDDSEEACAEKRINEKGDDREVIPEPAGQSPMSSSIDMKVDDTGDQTLCTAKFATEADTPPVSEAASDFAMGEGSSRDFLNASASMVSTMVAASQGRVNEVHVLEYMGVTIVCIAANFARQRQFRGNGGEGGPGSPFAAAKEVFQSAMFLAFMVNGQRYLATVKKKK